MLCLLCKVKVFNVIIIFIIIIILLLISIQELYSPGYKKTFPKGVEVKLIRVTRSPVNSKQ